MRRFRPIALFCVLLLVVQLAAAQSKSLAAKIDKILAESDARHGFWGVQVTSLTTGNDLYTHDEDKLFTPASNTKLFTTTAALELLGPSYRVHTTVESNGMLDRYGRLSGDLSLVGRGDPNLSGRVLPYKVKTERRDVALAALELLADQVVQKGVKFVDGDVVADDSYFAFERYGEGWSQDDLVWSWGAPVSALTLNDNVIFVSILPAENVGERAFVNITPFAEYYRIDNRVLTTPAGTGPRRIYINREPGSNHLTLWGNIPADGPGAMEALAIEDPADFAAQAFRLMLEKRGVVVYGRSRARHNELANLSTFSVTTTVAAAGGGDDRPPAVRALPKPQSLVLARYDSFPLGDDIQVINKVSQNLHAELVLRLIGREKGNAGTIEGGLEVVRGFLAQAGISKDEYVFYDGSGLSRQNLVTPRAMVKLLTYATTRPWAQLFQESLPVAGVDGSLADRFKGTVAEGRVSAKTGALGHVNALSGYATTVSGERVAFCIIANNHNLSGRQAVQTIDAIVQAIVDDEAKKKK